MADESIKDRIEQLVREEHALLARERADAENTQALNEDRARLERVTLELDRAWDLLRQRRALRGAGRDPSDAEPRDADTVERYQQ